ncbi:hypothetical protein OG756_06845 [Streptomyces sp. NBC_01310]|uniref:hypothetical protein n=1 Tax=Streptomyces sp. NBC_01310 TaxID=2903820 RepID=UPI0035B64832|nr:hypothetical protein OG756_06845 [Streptomyces sp. NBC_01310]
MSGRRRLDWLGLTPEPERELPAAVAALRASSHGSAGSAPSAGPVEPADPADPAGPAAAERGRVERLILRGSRRSWLRYLAEVTELVTAAAAGPGRGDRAAALLAGEVVLDHHRMLIGLPGTEYGHTADDRAALESAVRTLRTPTPATPTTPTTPTAPSTSDAPRAPDTPTTRAAPTTTRTVRTAPTPRTAGTARPGDSR